MKLSRRDFFKSLGLGAAAAGLSNLARAKPAAASAGTGPIAMPMPEVLVEDLKKRLQVPGSTDPLAAETVVIAENMEPVIPHDEQAAEAQKKLAALAKKTGQK